MIAIQCSRLFDGETFRAGGATVLIEENRIVAVESGFPRLGEQWEVLSYSDATVLPGLIDTHVHLVGDSRPGALDRVPGLSDDEIDRVISEGLERQLAAGVTTVRDLGDRRYSVVDRRDRQRTGDRATIEPTILASGPPLTKPAGHCHYMGGVVDGPDAISAAIRERAERKVDVVKVMASGGMSTPGTDVMQTQFTDDEMTMIVVQAHAAGLLVTAHAHGLPAVRQAVAASVDCIEHCTCLTDKGFDLPDELIDQIAANGIAVSGVIPPPKLDFNQAPPAVREMAAKMGVSPQQIRELRADMMRRMHQQGVRIVTGIDSGLNPWLAHGNLHIAFTLFEESGFSPAEVLAAATSLAAKTCGVEDRKGFLRSGYDADLIVVDGDLGSQPTAPLMIRSTLLGGRPISGS
ncbi:MAG TPA: amidohydrolase family protein [Propionibacteriaceae bacterium]|nr:amidohydrolase family protein [Propionibacteriaceae bacterium]